jgi:membrane-associated phospholipid phosphatase
MYLGVHYLSDVLGGAAWSLGWLTLCLIAVRTLQQCAQPQTSMPRSTGV